MPKPVYQDLQAAISHRSPVFIEGEEFCAAAVVVQLKSKVVDQSELSSKEKQNQNSKLGHSRPNNVKDKYCSLKAFETDMA